MLQKVLDAVQHAQGPVTLAELSKQLDIEASALEGMIQFWVRKGRLQYGDQPVVGDDPVCSCRTAACPATVCPTTMPRPVAAHLSE